MKAKIQLELFGENDEFTLMRKELTLLYIQQEKNKKKTTSRYNQLAYHCLSLQDEIESLKNRLDKLEKQSEVDRGNPTEDLLEQLFREAYLPQSQP